MTTALLSLFAACTNDDFISYEQGGQSGDAAMRPTVGVTLNVLEGDGADTRLSFIPGEDKGYLWQTNDTIGALLMDKVIAKDNNGKDIRPHDDIEAWEEMAWTSRYELVDYINTNYPFVRQSDGSWVTNAKMLEGNYFFTFPFAAYNGNREAIHSIGEQVQDGTSTASLQEAYANNQFFIGYARIHAGTEGGDVMSADLEMTPVLGAVGIKIKNVGNQDFTVKKIVLQSGAFNTLVKVDPTMAEYEGEDESDSYNLTYTDPNPNWSNDVKYFNYANYEEDYNADFTERFANPSDIYTLGKLVNNTEKSVNYNRKNALRAVMNGIAKNENANNGGSPINGADDRAELTVLNAPVQKGNQNATESFVIMTNIYDYAESEAVINAYIYTDRGMVGPVQISNINGEVNDVQKHVTVISENPIVKIAPDEVNSVTLEITDNSVQGDVAMNVYNESDLQQLIEWNNASTIRRVYKANLKNDVTLTKEMSDLLTKKDVNSKLYINTDGKKLVIAEGVAANILDYVLVSGAGFKSENVQNNQVTGTIVVENDLTLGSKSYVNGTYNVGNIHSGTITLMNELEVAEGASLTIASPITNETSGDYKDQSLVIAENEGAVTINAEVEELTIAENKADVTINANVTFIGTDANSNKNLENATITIGKDAIVSASGKLTNKGKNDYPGEDEYADWAVIYNNGQINNLVNDKYGKVIAGVGSTTNVDKNAGTIDKSADIKAVVSVKTGEDKGEISYTVSKDISLADVINAELTKLVIDGGDVLGVAFNVGNTADKYTASDVKWIEVKGQGGTLGTKIVNGAHHTSIFPKVEEVEVSANATFADVDFTNTDVEFNIKGGTTRIEGTVNAKGADIVLGSYDKKNYKGINATLNIPTTTDKLYANSIREVYGHKDEITSSVINQGYVELPNGKSDADVDKWDGVEVNKQPGQEPTKPVLNEENITIDGSEIATLKALQDKLNSYSDISALKTITISSNLDMSAEGNKGYESVLSGKDVILTGDITVNNLDGSMSLNTLKINNKVNVSSGEGGTASVMLTVKKIVVNSGATLHVFRSYIKVDGSVAKGSTTAVTKNGTIKYHAGAYIVADDMKNPNGMLTLNAENGVWE